jgi:hypothetical protein
MDITYQELKIKLPLEKGVIQVEDFTLTAMFNCHAIVFMRLLVEEEGIGALVNGLSDGAHIKVYEEEILFVGKVTMAAARLIKGIYYLDLTAMSYSVEWGLEEVSQSFLNLDATYQNVIDKVIAGREGRADIKDCVTKGTAIPDFLLQYEESDWDFLIRMASHFQSFLVPDYTADYGRAYFGIPNYEEEFILREEEYSTIKDMDRYYQVNLSGELLSQEI